jgi:hypothetical protein
MGIFLFEIIFVYLIKYLIMTKKKNKKSQIDMDKEYAAFLKKRLDSKNYKAAVSKEEYAETKRKYENVKLKIKLLG